MTSEGPETPKTVQAASLSVGEVAPSDASAESGSQPPPTTPTTPQTQPQQQPRTPKISPGYVLALIALIVGVGGALWLMSRGGRTLASGRDDFKLELVIIQLNDTYRVDAVENGRRGGLGRVATLVRQARQQHKEVLIVHAGDIIAPSLESKLFRGQQMVDALNHLHALAPVLAVPGNHEFDDKDPAMFLDAVERSKFRWLASNLTLDTGGRAMSNPVLENHVLRVGGLTLGVFALTLHGAQGGGDRKYAHVGYEEKYAFNDQTLESMRQEFSAKVVEGVGQLKGREFTSREELARALRQIEFKKPDGTPDQSPFQNDVLRDSVAEFASVGYVAIAERQIRQLERQGANVIIGLTHLDMPDDRQVALLRAAHPNFVWIAGGHEHYAQHERLTKDAALITKADSNARGVWKISIGLKDGAPEVREEKVELTESVEPDAGYQRDIAADYRARLRQRLSYIDAVIGDDKSIGLSCLYATEETVRNERSNWGVYLADQMRRAYAKEEAQIGVFNGGSIRIDDNVCGEIRFEHLERTFGFDAQVVFIKIHGQDLKHAILEHAVAGKRGDGRFLQAAGVRFDYDRLLLPGERVFNVRVREGAKWVPLDNIKVYAVAVPKYLFDCNDGYRFREKVVAVMPSESGPRRDLRSLVYDALTRAFRASNPAASGDMDGVFEMPEYVRDSPAVATDWTHESGFNKCPAKGK